MNCKPDILLVYYFANNIDFIANFYMLLTGNLMHVVDSHPKPYEYIVLLCPFAGSLAGFLSQPSQFLDKRVEVFANF